MTRPQRKAKTRSKADQGRSNSADAISNRSGARVGAAEKQTANLRQTHQLIWPCVVIVLAVFLVFSRTATFEFLNWDDDVNVYRNSLVTAPSAAKFARIWTQPYEELYIPLIYTLFTFEWELGGGRAWIYHIDNVALHAGAAVILFFLIRVLLENGTRRREAAAGSGAGAVTLAAAAGALLFALHPLQAEPVSWVTGRKDVLSGLCSLAALLFYVRWLIAGGEVGEQNEAGQQARSRAEYIVATLLFLCALLSKPSSIVVPVMAGAIGLYMRAPLRRNAISLVPWCVAAAVFAIITSRIQGFGAAMTSYAVHGFSRILVAADSLIFYARKILLPLSLSPIYPRSPQVVAHSAFAWVAVGIAMIAGALLVWRRGVWLLAIAIFAIPLLPILGFVPFAYQRHSTVADRYAYLALAGAGLLFAEIVHRLRLRFKYPQRFAVTACAGALLGLYGGICFHQSSFWRTSETLHHRILAIYPDNPDSLYNMATSYASESPSRDAEAVALLERALAARPDHARSYSNLFLLLPRIGRQADMKKYAEQATRTLQPAGVDELAALSSAYLILGDTARGAQLARGAAEHSPYDAGLQNDLGRALLSAHDYPAAERAFRDAIEVDPNFALAMINLADALMYQGREQQAIAALEHALQIEPQNARARQMLSAIREHQAQTRR